MEKKSSYSLLLITVIVVLAGVLAYQYVIKPRLNNDTSESLDSKGVEVMAQELNEEEETVEDLSQILKKLDTLDDNEASLRDQIEEVRENLSAELK